MAFDPSQFGAKPTTKKPFNPADFGAVPITQAQPTGGFLESAGQVLKTNVLGPQTMPSPSTAGKAITGALPAIGATLGGFAGGALGLVGGPMGAWAGGTVGAGLGAAAGEFAKQKIQGGPVSAGDIARSGAEFGALEAFGGPIFSIAGKAIKATGEGVAKMFIPKSDVEAGLLQTYKAAVPFLERVKSVLGFGEKAAPSTAASTAFEQGLVGTESMMGVQAKRAQTKLWDTLISPALKQSKVQVDIPAFLDAAGEKIAQETTDPTRLKSLTTALKAIKEDFAGIGKVSLEQLQKYKEEWAKWVPEKAYKGQPIAGALNDVRDTLSGMSREKIYSFLGDNVKQAYLDYSNLFGITELGKKAMAGGIVKAGGTFTGIKSIWELTTVPVGTLGGQTVYKVGQLAEFLGKPGAKILRNALGIPLFGTAPSQLDSTMYTQPR